MLTVVDEYLPELASRQVLTRLDGPLEDTVPAARAITVRALLTFRLGLGFGAGMWGPPGSVPIMDALGALGQGAPAPAGVPEAVSGLMPGDFDDMGWGFGMSVVTRRTQLYDSVGTYGWSGGLGTTWINDPAENLTLILLTQRAWTSHVPPAICRDFLTTAYQAFED